MRPVTISQTGAGSTQLIPLDRFQNPFNVGIGVVVDGTVNYTVQHTFDDVYDTSVTPTWFPHASLVTQTTSMDGNYAFGITATRLTVNSGAGSATMTIVQSGGGIG